MPVKTFWMFHKNIDRLQAEDDVRRADISLRLQASGEGANEAIQKLFTELTEKMKRPVRFAKRPTTTQEELDRAGLHALKLM